MNKQNTLATKGGPKGMEIPLRRVTHVAISQKQLRGKAIEEIKIEPVGDWVQLAINC